MIDRKKIREKTLLVPLSSRRRLAGNRLVSTECHTYDIKCARDRRGGMGESLSQYGIATKEVI